MKLPIILLADDGVTWWPEPRLLETSVESPDIEDGIYYTAWDSEGQILELKASLPVSRKSFLGLSSVSVSPGVLRETGNYEPEKLRSVILAHLKDRLPSSNTVGDLASVLVQLCREQPAC